MERLSSSLLRDAPPFHFRFRIESFSTLSTCSLQRYESCEFDVGDHKWKLVVYPNGNKSKDHISVYLKCTNVKEEILVSFTLLVFDHVSEKYRSVQDVCCFDEKRSEAGFDKFLSLELFKDTSNGYLFNDSCLFGVDIFVKENAPKGQCLSMITTKPAPFKYKWKLEKFSELEDKQYYSDKFTTRGHDWKLLLYPKGKPTVSDHLSLYLHLADTEAVGNQVVVECEFRILNRHNLFQNFERTYTQCLGASIKSWGFGDFMSLTKLNDKTGYLLHDTCIVEAEVTVLGSAMGWN